MGQLLVVLCGGREKKTTISDSDRAVLDLKNARDRLRKFEVKLSTESKRLTDQATALLKVGKRDRALLVVKIRRLREARIADVDSQLLKLEEMVNTLEWENQQSTVIEALQAGNQALKEIHAVMTVDTVEALMDETRDAIATEQTITDLLNEGLTSDLDQQAQEEFDQLSAEMTTLDLPEAPKKAVPLPEPSGPADDVPVPQQRVAVPA